MAPKKGNDALMDELTGGGMLIDDAPVQPDPNPLETAPAEKPLNAVEKSDALHATKAGGKGYKVTVTGEYIGRGSDSPNQKVKKNYTITANLPSLDRALSVLKGKVLDRAISKKHEDFIRVRTYKIVEAIPLSPATPESLNLQFMTREKLEAHVASHQLPIVVAEYSDTVTLRDAVVDCTLNPNGFKKREALKQADREEQAQIDALNPDI